MKKNIFVTPMIGMGDVLMTTPALELIKKQYPDSKITYCTMSKSSMELLKNNPDIDKLVNYPLMGKNKLSALFNFLKDQSLRHSHCITFYPSNRLHYNIVSLLTLAPHRIGHTYLRMNHSQMNWLKNETVKEDDTLHCVEENIRLLKFLDINQGKMPIPQMKVILDNDETDYGIKFVKSVSSSKCCIGVHAGTSVLKGHIARRWPKEYFAELINSLTDVHFLLFGTNEELEANQFIIDNTDKSRVTFVKDRKIREVASIIKACNFFLSNDSGLMHLAAAVNKPVLSIIGPTNPVYIHPWGVDFKVLSINPECGPCFRYSPKPLACNVKDQFRCLKELDVSVVKAAVQDFISRFSS